MTTSEPSGTEPDFERLAVECAPILMLDTCEPFSPQAVSVTYRQHASSIAPTRDQVNAHVSAPRICEIEYSIAWSADIGHVREVEHVWITLSATTSAAEIIAVEGSSHGSRRALEVHTGARRPVVYCEPGKHAHAGGPHDFEMPRDIVEWWCTTAAGMDGISAYQAQAVGDHVSVRQHRQATRALMLRAFTPSWAFTRSIDVAELPWVGPDAFEAHLAEQADAFCQGTDDGPLLLQAGPSHVKTGSDFIGILRALWRSDEWFIDDLPLSHLLTQARSERRRVILEVVEASSTALQRLWRSAWDEYCSSMITLVCPPDVEVEARQLGFRTARRFTHEADCQDSLWLVTATSEQTLLASRDHLVIGPGSADIQVA